MSKVADLTAREILDSRGNPTVECEIRLESGARARSAVPSGASTGIHEALELRDGDERYNGKGVIKAVNNVKKIIAPKIVGMEASEQEAIDNIMLELDGTPNKENLGANAILGVSLAVCRAAANENKVDVFEQIGDENSVLIPVPLINILNGGQHADNQLNFQEFMIVPIGFETFREAIRAAAEIFHNLKKVLNARNYVTAVGDEGGFAPNIHSNAEALEVIMDAINNAGYHPGEQVQLALDPAASEFYEEDHYVLRADGKEDYWSDEMIEVYLRLCEEFPIFSIEDGLAQDDWDGWRSFTAQAGKKIQIVGDDLYVTNTKRLQEGIDKKASNSILIKLNQIGTLTETLAAIKLAKENNFTTVISHRSGETEDTFISDLAVAVNAGQIKTGSVCRSERTAKYNQLLRIEEKLGDRAKYGIKL